MDELLATLQHRAEKLHAPTVRRPDSVTDLLADSFREFGSSGKRYFGDGR